MHRRHRPLIAVLLAAALLLAACGSGSDEGASDRTATTTATTEPKLAGSLTVAAAASLTESFTEIGKAFEAEYPGTKVAFTFDSSSSLAEQIGQGAPVDVFASADEANMTRLTDEQLTADAPVVFARNRLAIVTKPGNPAGITGLEDLAKAGVVSLCAATAPCGTFSATALEQAGATIPETSVTRGQNAKATLAAVSEGDAAAGIVYVTDAQAAGDAVDVVEIPDAQNVLATYPIAALDQASNARLAAAFIAFVRSDAGQAILAADGFLPPS